MTDPVQVTTEVVTAEAGTVEAIPSSGELFGARTHRLEFEPPSPFVPCNPCPAFVGGQWWCAIRAVDYRLGTTSLVATSRMYLTQLTADLRIEPSYGVLELRDVSNLAKNPNARNLGYEDLRLVAEGNELVAYATCCNVVNGGGFPEMCLLTISKDATIVAAEVLRGPWSRYPQKNWMPCADDHERVLYRAFPRCVLDTSDLEDDQIKWIHGHAHILDEHDFVPSSVRGSSQLIPMDGGYLAIVHEHKTKKPLAYVHRFLWLDKELSPKKVTPEFVWRTGGVEFCCGMGTADGKEFVAGFGVHDKEAWLARFDVDRVRELLRAFAI